MHKGGKVLTGVAAAALAACSTQQGKLEIRSTAVPPSAVAKPVPIRVAEGQAQLGMGNVALAIESFRKASREDPTSIDALLGMAESYDRMGRYDLSRRNYESALALAPGDTKLLGALAASLQLQGLNSEAAEVRKEIAERTVLATSAPMIASTVTITVPKAVEPVNAPLSHVTPVRSPAMEVAKPVAVAERAAAPKPMMAAPPPAAVPRQAAPVAPAQPAKAPTAAAPVVATPAPQPTRPAAPPAPEIAKPSVMIPALAPKPVQEPEKQTMPAASPTPVKLANSDTDTDAAPVAPPAKTVKVAAQIAESAEIGRSVTVALPAPKPVPSAPSSDKDWSAPTFIASRQASRPASTEPSTSDPTGPRIERLSMGVVALITREAPRWTALDPGKGQGLATPRFVPIREAHDQSRVRLLNAARVHRLAARTRAYLAGRGWQSISVGDASSTRQRSLILYPSRERLLAIRLSKQFGFPIAMRSGTEQVTVLLGHDAARMRTVRL